MSTRYWIATVSKNHALKGAAGGFIQVCHGKQSPLKRMNKGDLLLLYSSKIKMEGSEKCQKFTAIGKVVDDAVYQFEMTEHFKPFRRNMEYYDCEETSILPLINDLEFIQNKKSWGYPFRFGFFEIQKNDFNLIASNMLSNEIEG
jgi:hypothetical protein